MARPPFKPTDEHRKTVQAMFSYGIPEDEISKVIGCSKHTLQKYFRKELTEAQAKANAMVAQTCFQMAVSGRVPAATFFWLKTRAGWRETDRLELAGDKDSPLTITVRRLDKSS